jgi:hypothetical protein
MKTLEQFMTEILASLEHYRTPAGYPYLLVRDWSGSYYYGVWDGKDVDAKSLKNAPCESNALFNDAVHKLLAIGKVVQYSHLTTTWNGTTLNVFFGISGCESKFERSFGNLKVVSK